MAAMAEGLVLHAAADLVEALVGELHQVKGISDLVGVGQHRVERQAPGPRQVQHRPADRVSPALGHRSEPLAQPGSAAVLDHVEELAAGDVDDRGGPGLGPPPSQAGEEHLVDPERRDGTDTVDIGVEERLAVGDDGVVDRMPAGAELRGDIGHGPAVAADLECRPPCGAVGDRQATSRDPRVLMGP